MKNKKVKSTMSAKKAPLPDTSRQPSFLKRVSTKKKIPTEAGNLLLDPNIKVKKKVSINKNPSQKEIPV